MSLQKFYFDLYVEGNMTKNFYLDRVLVKSVSTLKNGPPMFFKEKHFPIKEHPLVSKWIKIQKIKFTKYRKLEVAVDTFKDSYFDTASKSLHFKGEPLLQTNPVVAASSSASSSSSQNVPPKSTPTTPRTMSTRRTSVRPEKASKKVKFSPLEEDKKKQQIASSKDPFTLATYMSQRGFSKFEYKKMDLYAFLDAYQTGCKRMKLTESQVLNNLLCFLGDEEARTYMSIRMHHNPADWEEFSQMLISHYHDTVYERTFVHLTEKCP